MARNDFNDAAIMTIIENPLLGSYGSYVNIPGGGVGSYAHNLLSAWVDIGILGFFLYIASFVLILIFILKFKKIKKDELLFIVAGLFFFTMPLMVFSKEYGYILFGLTVGFTARMINSANQKISHI